MKNRQKNIAVILLAAGVARRFGSNKLLAELRGKALVQHAAQRLEGLGAMFKVAAVSSRYHRELLPYFDSGWSIAVQTDDKSEPWDSLQLALQKLDLDSVSGVLVHLADMPYIMDGYFEQMLSSGGSVVSRIDAQTTPPFYLQKSDFCCLSKTNKLLKDKLRCLPFLQASKQSLRDVDREQDLLNLI